MKELFKITETIVKTMNDPLNVSNHEFQNNLRKFLVKVEALIINKRDMEELDIRELFIKKCQCEEGEEKVFCRDVENFPGRDVVRIAGDKVKHAIECFHIWRCIFDLEKKVRNNIELTLKCSLPRKINKF